MTPTAAAVLGKLREAQPGLHRIAAFWIPEAMADHIEDLRKAAKGYGIEVAADRLDQPDDLPDRLRALNPKPDGIWLPPDPSLINNRTFAILKDYSWSNDVPLYVPTEGLVEIGATAYVSSGFREIGRTAAETARLAADDKPLSETVYPETVETVFNRTAARSAGLEIPEEALRKATRVLP